MRRDFADVIMRSMMNRREFSQLAAGAALAQAFSLKEVQAAPAPPAVRFSVMLWTLEKQNPFDRCLEIVAEAGYQGVELTGQWRKWSPEDTQRIKAKMHSLGLVFDLLSGVKPGFADPNGSAAFLAAFSEQIKVCKDLDSPMINLRSGNVMDGVERSVQHTAAVENLRRAAELAAAAGVQFVIEPVDPLEAPKEYLTTVTEGFEIVREVASPQLKVLYDFYHEQRAYGNLIEKLEKNFDLVGLVHIADVPGRHEPGTGEIDYANIYRKLAELKYNKFITMEFYPTGDPVAALKKARLEALQAMASV
jgi:hydroxypyruvate isomerase